MFTPPRCPNTSCRAHHAPQAFQPRFFSYNGSNYPKCRAQPVRRFKCRICKRRFSRQTFRVDYCDNKPHLNAYLFKLLASGMGLRQSARILGLSRRCTELKARKLARHLGRLNRNLTDQFDEDARFQLDEMETFEGERAVLPVTVPVMIESKSMFVLATDVATIKPSGKMTEERRQAVLKQEKRLGKRREDRSKAALERTFRRLRYFCRNVRKPWLTSDKKIAYATIGRRFFGASWLHTTISSKQKRDQTNPLRGINLTNAMARDLNGRLRRESWLVSKARRYLRLQLYVFAAYRNFIRRRINRLPETPAQVLGFLPRPAKVGELLGWRQDWRWNSVHPLARSTESIAHVRGRAAA